MQDSDRLTLPVTLTMMDGRHLVGDFVVNLGGTVERTINNDMRFVRFCDMNGNERLISKDSIAEVEERKTAKIISLPTEGRLDGTDPYAVLEIERTATDGEIREAYLRRAKSYHADRFANVELPREVAQYTDSMSRRINEAYAILTSTARKNGAQHGSQ